MSLHNLAHHLQSAGRGEDKVLVHMTPGEVKGLQSLAMAQGGSLTINPETGLPEAGILKSLLPMIAGFALGPAGLGMTAMKAGLTTAAVGAAATGSLKKGLMAGLGAYSGAGLGAGLQSMAAPAAAPAVPGLSPTVAANASTLGGTSPLANVATGADDILASTDELMGIKPNYFDPRASSVFVKNAPVPTVAPANAAKFLGTDATNQAILGKFPSNLPVATGGPQPFQYTPTGGAGPVDFTVGGARPPADTYFDPSRAYNPSGSLSGSSEAAKVKGFGAQRDIYNKGLFGRKGDIVEVVDNPIVPHSSVLETSTNVPTAAPKPFKMPEGATGWSGNSSLGYKYYVGGDEIGGAFPVRGNLTAAGARYTPSTATTSQPFAGGMKHVPSTSTAVDVSEQSISRPFTDKMAELGRGARASFGSVEGLKGLYAASEAAAPYGMYAGLGSTAYSMYDEKRQQMEDEARARAEANQGLIRPYEFDYGVGSGENVSAQPYSGSAERTYFQPTYTAGTPYKAPGPEYAADGGLMGYAVGGPIEQMADMNAVGMNTGYPMANLQTPMYSNPSMQRPEATNVIAPSADAGVGAYNGEQRFSNGGPAFMGPIGSGYVGAGNYIENARLPESTAPRPGRPGGSDAPLPKYSYNPETMQFSQTVGGSNMSGGIATPAMQQIRQPTSPARPLIPNIDIPAYQTPEQQLGLGGFYDYMNQQLGGFGGYAGYAAGGGVSTLGDYSDGGRLLKGPGDGVSDSIPASIGNRQPARLADGEFVVPARIVSEIGNGSTEAGARKLYAMMDRVQNARKKSVGKKKVAVNSRADKYLPA